MRTLLRWRAERAVEGRDDRPDPDLLLIDGGEGQRNAALEALEAVGWDVPVVGLAKADERVITADGSLAWDADDPALHLLQRVRDEAHRFAVQYHQTIRDAVSTPLDDVAGVGSAASAASTGSAPPRSRNSRASRASAGRRPRRSIGRCRRRSARSKYINIARLHPGVLINHVR
jgi:hypothetical protein